MVALLAPLIAALPSFAPVLIQIGLWAINLFISDSAQKDANEKAFLDAVSAHMNDSLGSVVARQNAWAQRQELEKRAKERDTAPVKDEKPNV